MFNVSIQNSKVATIFYFSRVQVMDPIFNVLRSFCVFQCTYVSNLKIFNFNIFSYVIFATNSNFSTCTFTFDSKLVFRVATFCLRYKFTIRQLHFFPSSIGLNFGKNFLNFSRCKINSKLSSFS